MTSHVGVTRLRAPVIRLADQMVSSVTNAGLVVLLAQVATAAEFGRLTIVYGLLMGLVGLNRAVIGDGIQLREFDAAENTSATGKDLSTTLVYSSLVYAVVVLAVSLSLAQIGWEATIVLTAAMPIVALQDGLRVHALMTSQPWRALTSDAVWLIVVACSLGFKQTSELLLSFWSLGALVSLTILMPQLSRPELNFYEAKQVVRKAIKRRRNNALDFSAVVVGSLASLLLLGAFAPVAVAQARAATALLAPVDAFAAGVRFSFLRLLGRKSDQRNAALLYGSLLAGALGTYVALLLILDRVFLLSETVAVLKLGKPVLIAAVIIHLLKVLLRPLIDRALATKTTMSVGLGRVVGETAGFVLLWAMRPTTASPFFAARALSISGASIGAGLKSRKSEPDSDLSPSYQTHS